MFGLGVITPSMFAFLSPGPIEIVIIGVVAVLLFGSRLPSVARSLGKSLVEFKKGMHGVEEELNSAVYSPPSRATHDESVDDHDEASTPRFEPPTAEPRQETAESESS